MNSRASEILAGKGDPAADVTRPKKRSKAYTAVFLPMAVNGPALPDRAAYVDPQFFGAPEAWSACLWLYLRPWHRPDAARWAQWCETGFAQGRSWAPPVTCNESLPIPRSVYREIQRRAAYNDRSIGAEASVVLNAGFSLGDDDGPDEEFRARYFVPSGYQRVPGRTMFVRHASVWTDLGALAYLARISLRLGVGLDVAVGAVLTRGLMRLATGIVRDRIGEATRAAEKRVDYRIAKMAAAVGEAQGLHLSDVASESINNQTAEIEGELSYIKWVHDQCGQWSFYAKRREAKMAAAQSMVEDKRNARRVRG